MSILNYRINRNGGKKTSNSSQSCTPDLRATETIHHIFSRVKHFPLPTNRMSYHPPWQILLPVSDGVFLAQTAPNHSGPVNTNIIRQS